MAGLRVERDLARQESDDARGWVNNLLGEVKKERDLKLKAKGVSTELAVEVARDKAKINALEIEVSWQNGEIDKLRSDVKGDPSASMSFFFLDLRCFSDMVGIMA
jgi:hypothetical protein